MCDKSLSTFIEHCLIFFILITEHCLILMMSLIDKLNDLNWCKILHMDDIQNKFNI